MEGRIELWKPDDSLRYAAERVDIGVGAAVGGFAMRQIISNVANGEITVVSGGVGQATHVTLQAPSADR